MNPPPMIPQIPDNAPFTPEQRAYLNGFLAGLFSRVPAPGAAAPPAGAPAAAALVPLTILFGSQTGTSEKLAKRVSKEAAKRGFAPTTHDMAAFSAADLAQIGNLLVVTSTYGDGEPPDSAKGFWGQLATLAGLPGLRYSVCALGDSNYPRFCAFGKDVDARLEALGATRSAPRVDCDLDLDVPFAQWMDGALRSLAPSGGTSSRVTAPGPMPAATEEEEGYSKTRPYSAALVGNRVLNQSGSEKETRHLEFAVAGPGMAYEAGDALGVVPSNCPELVADLINALACPPDTRVPLPDGTEGTLEIALTRHYEITRIPNPLLAFLAEQSGDPELLRVAAPTANGELTKFLRGREIIDLLIAHPHLKGAPVEFVRRLKRLQPRLYSISSSPKAHPGQVHLTVGIVRYNSLGRPRKGVCSTFLADRASSGPVPVFIHSNKNFRPPASGDTPMILVGPGTGIAPFRGFLHERRATGATGRNWLFFGDQRQSTDFLYREEMESLHKDGFLTRMDLAFSRDQAEKVYVQHRMLESAAELHRWLEEGAHFYVCGDAGRMARDVDEALHEVVRTAGGRTADGATAYIAAMKASGRYQRDVY